MKVACFLLLIFLPGFFWGQSSSSSVKGIQFEKNLSWKDIVAKAARERKYIFVDCYATWCKPCKEMELKVYPLENVGEQVNPSFISVKYQMDTTANDKADVKANYYDAKRIKLDYSIDAYPTLLFFNPDGKLVHQALGGYSSDRFINLVHDALNPAKQFFTLLADYQNGNKDTNDIKYLVSSAQALGKQELVKRLISDYISLSRDAIYNNKDQIRFVKRYDLGAAEKLASSYLAKIKNKKTFNEDDLRFAIEFKKLTAAQQIQKKYVRNLKKTTNYKGKDIENLIGFAQTSHDLSFTLLLNNRYYLDSLSNNKQMVSNHLTNIIYKEEIYPSLDSCSKVENAIPNWNLIRQTIQTKYDSDLTNRAITSAEIAWFRFKRDWDLYTISLIRQVNNYGDKDNWFYMNASAWEIFQRSNNPDELKLAITWIERLFQKKENAENCYVVDTYANLLYKLGHVDEAIKWEEKAVALSNSQTSFLEYYNKMKQGIQTWPSN